MDEQTTLTGGEAVTEFAVCSALAAVIVGVTRRLVPKLKGSVPGAEATVATIIYGLYKLAL